MFTSNERPNTNCASNIIHTVEHNPYQQVSEAAPSNDNPLNVAEITPHSHSSDFNCNAETLRRSNRTVRPRVFDDTITGEWWKRSRVHSSPRLPESINMVDGIEEESALISISDVREPKSYSEAKSSPQWSDWEKAFQDEMASLQENNV